MLRACATAAMAAASVVATPTPPSGGDTWEHVGPWNLFDGTNPTVSSGMGEAGTLASAASPAAVPDLIYAGGQNNGVSSGVIKTIDGGLHWTRQSKGLWDTRILGVWIHPDDPKGGHVFAGTHSGIYESKDSAESWELVNETASWGAVMSFRQGVIDGKDYIVANAGSGFILTRPLAEGAGPWQKIKAPGGMAPNMYLSIVTTAGKSEVLTCIGGWGGGKLYYGALDTPTTITWDGPLMTQNETFTDWAFHPNDSGIYAKCKTPTSCDPDVHSLGKMPTLEACQKAVNGTHDFPVATWTYQHQGVGGGYDQMCYIVSTFTAWEPHPQPKVDSGRAPGFFPGAPVDCANAAVDPNDRNHFLYSKGGEYKAWHSEDGGKTVKEYSDHNTGVYFVSIDEKGWMYTATQAGAFVTEDKGATWYPLHVMISSKTNCRETAGPCKPSQPNCGGQCDRVPHDYQNIIPNFRGDGIAFPSDQGLHILDRLSPTSATNSSSNHTLISAIGDMHNSMALSAIISPSKDGKSRHIVANLWDWNVVVSWDDGASWQVDWPKGNSNPLSCGEGGGGQGLGSSGHMFMAHHAHWYSSADGGLNFMTGTAPGTPGGGFDYVRTVGSRTEPSGMYFALMGAPAAYNGSDGAWASVEEVYTTTINDEDEDQDNDDDDDEENEEGGTVQWMMLSEDFGMNFTFTKMPADLQPSSFIVDPTTSTSLFALAGASSKQPDGCLAHSTTNGKDWTACSKATGLTGRLLQLIIKDSKTMFMLRQGAVPLKTVDGGKTWVELTSPALAKLFKYGAALKGCLSWSGKTLVIHGADMSAIGRQERATVVYKSTDDGATWTDETGDIITVSPGQGVWYEKDFYFVTAGEGITVKRNFEL